MSQLERTVNTSLEKAKNEIADAISKARGQISKSNPIRILNSQPTPITIPNTLHNSSFHNEYKRLQIKQHQRSSKTKIRLSKDCLQIEHETHEQTKELNIIQETLEYNKQLTSQNNTQHQAYPQDQLVQQSNFSYKQECSYTVHEQGSSTTYELFKHFYPIAELDVITLVPNKAIDKRDLPSGLHGFTYLGTNYMAINEKLDQAPVEKQETMIHEAIHTMDEYETRVITWWMLSKDKKYAVLAKKTESYSNGT